MVVVFDVNGTLLNTEALRPVIRSVFGRKVSTEEFFTRVVQSSMALTLVGDYMDFGDIAVGALRMLGTGFEIETSDKQVRALQSQMVQMPPFRDVKHALRKLRKAGYRLATLTNSAPSTLAKQLGNAGIEKYFEQTLTVDLARRFKPARETYEAAAASLRVSTGEMMMVAAHHWDLLGASRAGCRTAFISRRHRALMPGWPVPEYVVRDLNELVRQLESAAGVRKKVTAGYRNKPFILAAGAIGLGIAGTILVPFLSEAGSQSPREEERGTVSTS